MGYAVESPPCLMGVQYSALGDPFSNMLIGGFQEMSPTYLGPGQSTCTDFEVADNTKDFDDVVEAHSNQGVKPSRED